MTYATRLGIVFAGLLVLGAAFGAATTRAQKAFITTWATTSSSESVTIPTKESHSDYHFTIDWGDGTTETITGADPDPSHTYRSAGTYSVEITVPSDGAFPRIYLNAARFGGGSLTNAKKLQSIDQWGSIEWESMERAFTGAANVTHAATDAPDLSDVTSTASMFKGASSFNGDLGNWDTGHVTNMKL